MFAAHEGVEFVIEMKGDTVSATARPQRDIYAVGDQVTLSPRGDTTLIRMFGGADGVVIKVYVPTDPMDDPIYAVRIDKAAEFSDNSISILAPVPHIWLTPMNAMKPDVKTVTEWIEDCLLYDLRTNEAQRGFNVSVMAVDTDANSDDPNEPMFIHFENGYTFEVQVRQIAGIE